MLRLDTQELFERSNQAKGISHFHQLVYRHCIYMYMCVCEEPLYPWCNNLKRLCSIIGYQSVLYRLEILTNVYYTDYM